MRDKEYLAHAVKTIMIPWSFALLLELSTRDGPDFTALAIIIGAGVALSGWITINFLRKKRKPEVGSERRND